MNILITSDFSPLTCLPRRSAAKAGQDAVMPYHVALILFALGFLAICPLAQAVLPQPDGGYPGGNTAEGQSALLNLTTGEFNTAVGFLALRGNTESNFNTAIGAGALFTNTADNNTATGAGALLSNTTGDFNTANGAFALFHNTTGGDNTANGASALLSNTEGDNNTATGFNALHDNTIGFSNTANGRNALFGNASGSNNTAMGFEALGFNTSGSNNTAIGRKALESNHTGSGNIALGVDAGTNVTTASNVICIGAIGADESNSCFIGNIFDQTSSGGTAVFVNAQGKLGTITSSRRFKEEIKSMENASETLFALKPVTFQYKTDNTNTPQFGLIAEDVAAVNPDLVVRDKDGNPYTVRYEQIDAMLLNEFLKEHKKVERLEVTVANLAATVKVQASQIQNVSAQLELNKVAPQVVKNADLPRTHCAF